VGDFLLLEIKKMPEYSHLVCMIKLDILKI
jgi:hypothetical protein